MAGIVKMINGFIAEGTLRDNARKISTGNDTKHPHVAVGVVLWMRPKSKTDAKFREAFSEVVKELQSKSYLKRGSMTSTGKGVTLSRQLQMVEEYDELMEEYAAMLDKIRKGKEERYRGPIPLK